MSDELTQFVKERDQGDEDNSGYDPDKKKKAGGRFRGADEEEEVLLIDAP
jgi:hypothetical protein